MLDPAAILGWEAAIMDPTTFMDLAAFTVLITTLVAWEAAMLDLAAILE